MSNVNPRVIRGRLKSKVFCAIIINAELNSPLNEAERISWWVPLADASW